jgi:histidinol-phosphate aminotransferase
VSTTPGNLVANVTPAVAALGAYTLKVTVAPVKLNQNESPWDVPADFKARVLARCEAASWNRYPDFYPQDVLAGIGALHGLDEHWVMLGNGSNELIAAVLGATVGAGRSVAYPVPTFSLYAMMIAAAGGTSIEVPLTDSLEYDLPAFERLADEGSAHLLLCTPNNPTGTRIDPEQVAALAGRTERLVIVDEAYVHFGPDDHSLLMQAHPNIVVLRTLSKALGLAGVRLGYALAHPSLVEHINKVKLPYNVGIFGLEVARALLSDPAIADEHAARLVVERQRLATSLRATSQRLIVFDGHANFVLIRLPEGVDASEVWTRLLDDGILVRNVSHYPGLDRCLRISVGTLEENDLFLAAFERTLKELS